jgi:hypothetical protein
VKFLRLRTLLALKGLDWVNDNIVAIALTGYTFDENHATLADIESAGGTVVSTARTFDKSVTVDGWAASAPVTLPVLAIGTYTLILAVDTNGRSTGMLPLVSFHGANAITTVTNGDVIVRPENSDVTGVGKWFRF